MKPVLTPDEAGALDRATQEAGTPAEVLMERAGRAVARAAVDLVGGVYGRRAVVVCGKGNNGGDGLVAARHLARWGMRVAVIAVETADALREPAASNLARLDEVGVHVRGWSSAALRHELSRADVAIDALFGTGFRGFPEDAWADAIEGMDEGAAPVVAVDIPSGVNGATGAVEGLAVRADVTVTFGAAKVGAVLLPGAEYAGAVRVVDIGFPDELLRADAYLVESSDVAGWLPTRPIDTHKRATGVLVVVAGSRGMTGAPVLVAEAAARIGAGLVTVAAPAEIVPTIQAHLTEATFLPLPTMGSGSVAGDALPPVLELLGRADALAIGPGLTTDEETAGFVRDLVRASPVPVVVDADALNAFEGRTADLADRKAAGILTPHAGEFARLTGLSARELDVDRLGHVRRLAHDAGAVALLKGSRTIVVDDREAARINPTGGPVLATAGSGDVLTGMIGGLVARGLAPSDAAAAAAYVHGVAGMLAGRRTGDGTLAGDIARAIPDAIALMERT
ncbi:MAG: NAD(P)H-hydrate dehydratase [Actinomycetota bacterium]